MRFKRASFRPSLLAAVVAGIAGLAADGASAGGFYQDHVYADSYGNLVVYSPSGAKRIVVGQGYLAADLRDAMGAGGPKIVRSDGHARKRSHCYSEAVLWKGRGYMYGLPDGAIPQPPVFCD